jgi:hypothetical protein
MGTPLEHDCKHQPLTLLFASSFLLACSLDALVDTESLRSLFGLSPLQRLGSVQNLLDRGTVVF